MAKIGPLGPIRCLADTTNLDPAIDEMGRPIRQRSIPTVAKRRFCKPDWGPRGSGAGIRPRRSVRQNRLFHVSKVPSM